MPIRKFLLPIIIVCILLEIGFNVFFNTHLPQAVNAIGLFSTSVFIGLLIIFAYYKRHVVKVEKVEAKPWQRIGITTLWLGLAIIFCLNLASTFIEIPIDPKLSDIIPTVQIAVTRFLSGSNVYSPLDFTTYSLPLTYLPMQWLPYCISEVLHFDYRWIALAICTLSVIWILQRSMRGNVQNGLIITALAIINYAMIRKFNDGILAMTIEIMVAGYYVAFIAGLGNKNAIVKGLMIAVCLMSRYSLVLWLPLWVMVEFVSGNRKQLGISLIVITLFILGIYGIPFLSKDPGIFMRGYKYYSQAALGEWQHLDPQQRPYHLFNGHGFAWLFYTKINQYSLPDRIKSLQKMHLIFCLGSVVVMGIWYWFNRKRVNYKLFLLGSFKIYLSIFLAFIQVPYAYLMITGSFVSIAILAEVMRYRISEGPDRSYLDLKTSL